MEKITVNEAPVPLLGEDWFDPLEAGVHQHIRSFIEAIGSEPWKVTTFFCFFSFVRAYGPFGPSWPGEQVPFAWDAKGGRYGVLLVPIKGPAPSMLGCNIPAADLLDTCAWTGPMPGPLTDATAPL
jgi:hypothetical protein